MIPEAGSGTAPPVEMMGYVVPDSPVNEAGVKFLLPSTQPVEINFTVFVAFRDSGFPQPTTIKLMNASTSILVAAPGVTGASRAQVALSGMLVP